MSNKIRKEKIQKCRKLLNYLIPKTSETNETKQKETAEENVEEDRDINKNKYSCPFCKKRTITIIRKIYQHRTVP